MLTVKHIDEWGNERVYEAADTYWRSGHKSEGVAAAVRGLDVRLPDNAILFLEAREDPKTFNAVYVMNDKGATVASYGL